MRISILASGSRGNALLVSSETTTLMVDAGISPRLTEGRMRLLKLHHNQVDAILITHAHADHVGKVWRCAEHFSCPVYATSASFDAMRASRGIPTRTIQAKAGFRVGDISVDTWPIPHDAPQIAVSFRHEQHRATLATDLGHVPEALRDWIQGSHVIMIESNHDPEMLKSGPYPRHLQDRIAGPEGHLSNAQCAALVTELREPLRAVVLMHLSQRCNTPRLAEQTAREAIGTRNDIQLHLAHQQTPIQVDTLALGIPQAPTAATSA